MTSMTLLGSFPSYNQTRYITSRFHTEQLYEKIGFRFAQKHNFLDTSFESTYVEKKVANYLNFHLGRSFHPFSLFLLFYRRIKIVLKTNGSIRSIFINQRTQQLVSNQSTSLRITKSILPQLFKMKGQITYLKELIKSKQNLDSALEHMQYLEKLKSEAYVYIQNLQTDITCHMNILESPILFDEENHQAILVLQKELHQAQLKFNMLKMRMVIFKKKAPLMSDKRLTKEFQKTLKLFIYYLKNIQQRQQIQKAFRSKAGMVVF